MRGMTMRARILAQGDEITTGATVDTNSAWIAELLSARGARVVGIAAAPDDPAMLERLIAEAARDCDLLVSGGGLGPTTDDCTAEAAARAAGVDLQENAPALEQIRARFALLGRPMTPSNAKQALVPRGSTLLENPLGTAPGFAIDLGPARAFFFPGVPRELRAMVEHHLRPWLDARGLAPMMRRRFHVCGVGESVLQDRLKDLALPAGVRLGYKAWVPYNTIVLYGDPAAPGAAEAFARACGEVRARLGEDCFGEDETTLPKAVGELLAARGWRIAVAESCTGGGAGALLTAVPGSSAWFRGGVIAYANEVKTGLLGVPEGLLLRSGAVGEDCARAMAEGVRRATGAEVGLAITGVAGPDGGTAGKPVGTVCFGRALPGETAVRTVRFGARGRDVVRDLAAATAVEWLRRRLIRTPGDGA
jgi:nicotinamide-nucleotide amidase